MMKHQQILDELLDDEDSKLKFPKDFILPPNAPRKKYSDALSKKLSNRNQHYGQFKLLMSELEVFLMPNATKIKYVVYAGAAPGTHIRILAKYFPKVKWLLYDPRNVFDEKLKKCRNVCTYVQYFTENDATIVRKMLDKKKAEVMLISDIRNNDIGKAKDKKDLGKQQEIVYEDMVLQEKWYKILKPEITLFKFRLSWEAGHTTYYNGKLFYPIYGKHATTEFRLFIKGKNAKKIKYDNRKYEEQCFYFNTHMRPQWDKQATHKILDLFSAKYNIKKQLIIRYIKKVLFQ